MFIKGINNMKIFHISDLHIGKIIHGVSMIEEQEHVFKQIIDSINELCPQAVIIAGDVYDRTVPSVEAVRVFDNFITNIAETNTPVLLISGNHDSGERLGYASRLLTEKKLFFSSFFEGRIQKITLQDEYGNIHFWLLPFVKPIYVRGTYENVDSYEKAIAVVLENENINYQERNILISHQFYTNADNDTILSDSESHPVGGLDAVSIELVEKFDYVALGHLHRAQSVGGKHIRYSGSPLKYSFSEVNHKKGITVVDFFGKGEINISDIPLVPLHDMRDIRGKFEELLTGTSDDYIRVILTDEEEQLDPVGRLRTRYPNILSLQYANRHESLDFNIPNIDRLNVSSYELFCEFFKEIQESRGRCAKMSQEQADIVQKLLE